MSTKPTQYHLAVRYRCLCAEVAALDTHLQRLLAEVAPELLAVKGVGVDVAATLLVAAGDQPHRLRSESAFAHLCGVAPIPASSGKTHRHRLNRGGDRDANRALYIVAVVRLACDPRTRAYVARRTAQGLSKAEILRCLKRYLAREIYRVLVARPAPASALTAMDEPDAEQHHAASILEGSGSRANHPSSFWPGAACHPEGRSAGVADAGDTPACRFRRPAFDEEVGAGPRGSPPPTPDRGGVAMLATPLPVPVPRLVARVRPLPVAVCTLAGATALIHLVLAAMTSVMLATQPELVASLGGATMLTVMAALFYANGAGYVVLSAALYLPHPALRRFRRVTRWALIAFTAATVVAYFAMIQGHFDAFGLADKAIEALLLALLMVEDRQTR